MWWRHSANSMCVLRSDDYNSVILDNKKWLIRSKYLSHFRPSMFRILSYLFIALYRKMINQFINKNKSMIIQYPWIVIIPKICINATVWIQARLNWDITWFRMQQQYFGENAVLLANLCRLYLMRQKYSMFDKDETPVNIIIYNIQYTNKDRKPL